MNKPNIVFIVSDQHRGDFMGCAGNPFVHTPNMDRMAQEGVRFTQAYCNAPLCVPSRMSMMTGRYPHRIGVWDNGDLLGSDVPTYAHTLALAGYETVLCGRMHFKGPDQRHGFQKRLVGDIVACYDGGPSADFGYLRGTVSQGIKSIKLAGPGESAVVDYDLAVTEGCEQFLQSRSADDSRPLLLTVGFFAPHSPYVCPPDLYEQAYKAMEGHEAIPRDQDPLHPWMEDWYQRLKTDEVRDEQVRVARAGYAGLIGQLDRCVGRVVDAARSLPGDTIIVYVSDHGDMAGDRRMFWKQSFYEGAAKVPMVWYAIPRSEGGEQLLKGKQLDVPVSLVDLAPTFAGLSGVPQPPGIDGKDLTPLLTGTENSAALAQWVNRPVFSELKMLQSHSPFRMVRHKQYKLIYHHDAQYPVQLYDLDTDPQERNDLGQSPDYAEVRERLISMVLDDWEPNQVHKRIKDGLPDRRYLAQWGKEVGMGPMDLWGHM